MGQSVVSLTHHKFVVGWYRLISPCPQPPLQGAQSFHASPALAYPARAPLLECRQSQSK
ncbi:Uncharacterised protein [Vibrio cholerae]|nr:Uncharacterised protein [Vibrio cholerae]